MKQRVITIIGGSGFLGTYLVRELAKTGATLQIITRHPEEALYLKTAGPIGQIVITPGNISHEESLKQAITGSWAVINLVGVLYSRGKQNFSALHTESAERLAKIAKTAGCERFIQVSALAVDRSPKSRYAQSKLAGENAVLAAFPQATIIRPGLLIGAEDNFFNKFAQMSSLSPVLPLIGGGVSLFQPVYVDDVAKAITLALLAPATRGKIIELAGPKRYSFKALLELLMAQTRRQRLLLPIPFALAKIMAFFFELLPVPVITRDQVRLLQTDNVIEPKEGTLTFADLGMKPVAIEMVMPRYLERYNYGV